MQQSIAQKAKNMFSTRNKRMLILSTALVAVLSVAGDMENERLMLCGCANNVEFDKRLPVSHPSNMCAAQQTSGVSWVSWFTGSSASKQFHYLDLLELLTRVTDSGETQRSS